MSEEPQVSWKAIERGSRVLASDGKEIGKVKEIAGDAEADIFSGLVISTSALGSNRFLPAERVAGIWPERVTTDLGAGEVERLAEYRDPVSERLQIQDDFMNRLRRLFGFTRKRGPRN